MIFVLIFILVGVTIGLMVPLHLFAVSSFYVSVGILAAMDSILGALKASYDDEFDFAIFSSGLFINILMAMTLSWIGDKLGVPLYYAAIFVFGTRLFNNLALVRRRMIENMRERRALHHEIARKRKQKILETAEEKDEMESEIGMEEKTAQSVSKESGLDEWMRHALYGNDTRFEKKSAVGEIFEDRSVYETIYGSSFEPSPPESAPDLSGSPFDFPFETAFDLSLETSPGSAVMPENPPAEEKGVQETFFDVPPRNPDDEEEQKE